MILLKGEAAAHCRRMVEAYPEVPCLFISLPVPKILNSIMRGKLNAYGMCLNHWIPLPAGVVLLNASWLSDKEKLEKQYRIDCATGYHPACEDAITYIIRHEFAHVLYNRLPSSGRNEWKAIFKNLKSRPSGYSTTPEECFCEAFASSISDKEKSTGVISGFINENV